MLPRPWYARCNPWTTPGCDGLDPDRVLVFFNGYRSGARHGPESFQLLPLDRRWLWELAAEPWPTRVIPGFAAPVEELLDIIAGVSALEDEDDENDESAEERS